MVLIGGAEERAAVQICTDYLPKTLIHYIFTLKMATAMFAETSDNRRASSPKAEIVYCIHLVQNIG
jgi:hypothetical protein